MSRAKRKRTDGQPYRAMRTGNLKAEIMATEVDNPHYSPAHDGMSGNPKKIAAFVNVRESAVTTLAARGVLNGAQVAAATRFRSLWEAMGGAGAGAFDYSREFVDGGRSPEPISERQVNAGKELAECRALLGYRGYKLVSLVCGEGYALHEISASKRDRLTAADNLRTCLDDLCEMWQLATGHSQQKQR